MQETTQQTVFGDEYAQLYELTTKGRIIRPIKQLICEVLGGSRGNAEFKLHLSNNGLSVQAVDPSNVMAIEATLNPGAFESYELAQDITLGVAGDILGGLFQHARYGVSTNDEITIQGGERKATSKVTREVDGVDVTFNEQQSLIDPNSVRQDFEKPELDLDASLTIPTRTFIEVVGAVEHDYVNIQVEDGLVVESESDIAQSRYDIDVETKGEVEEAIYSHSMIQKIANALHMGKVDDEISLRLDDEFPIFVEFARDGLYSGEIMLAPRLKKE
jgi:DNA polymerase III sliding clamp (beta) subunit (PCNA family)